MSAVIVASRKRIDRGPGSRERLDASPGLGLLLRAFCYCCSITSRGITIAIGRWPHASGADLYAGAELPNPDDVDEGCPAPLYAGVPPSHDPSQLLLFAAG